MIKVDKCCRLKIFECAKCQNIKFVEDFLIKDGKCSTNTEVDSLTQLELRIENKYRADR